jgi:hypothetical protein
MASWWDVPHLDKRAREDLLKTYPEYQRDARSKGIPQLGSGAIYPTPDTDILVDDFTIPHHWPRGFGMDVGWNWTAAIWGALDRQNDVLYLYSEYLRGRAEPSVHVLGIQARGKWIPGVIDPAANGRSQIDGRQLLDMYQRLGLDIETADNSVETGIYEVWQRMGSGRLKVFRSLKSWQQERNLYRRDEKGRVVKKQDHLQDSVRYLVMSGITRMRTKPVEDDTDFEHARNQAGWTA